MDNTRTTTTATTYTDERGHEHAACHLCGVDCSTHPDAGNPLANCGDCGRATCPDHRVDDTAARCNECAAAYYSADATANRATPATVDDFITVPAWNVTGQIIATRPAMNGTEDAIEVLLETRPDDPRPRWFRLEPTEYTIDL